MATLHFTKSRIAGIACTLPSNKVTTAEVAAALGADPKRVLAMSEIESRRIAPPGMCASDLCTDAASRLIDELGWQRESIGALIFVTKTPDYILPATA
jgi:3-oxoacyl-[acyl-carrier-protein] synthase-3